TAHPELFNYMKFLEDHMQKLEGCVRELEVYVQELDTMLKFQARANH
ncbi:15439_t:CDS:1, partial [Dentiscutata heterogama]